MGRKGVPEHIAERGQLLRVTSEGLAIRAAADLENTVWAELRANQRQKFRRVAKSGRFYV